MYYVEDVPKAKPQHQWTFQGYDCVISWEKLALWGNGIKRSRYVNELNINKTEFNLAWIRL